MSTYISRNTFEESRVCKNYLPTELFENITFTGDTACSNDLFISGSGLLLAGSQDGITYPEQEIYKILFGTGAEASIYDDGIGNVLLLHRDEFTYSLFQGNDGTNSNIAQTQTLVNRDISQPTTEGNPFKIGSYVAGQSVPTSFSNITINHTSKVRYITGMTFSVIVYNADNSSILDSFNEILTTSPIIDSTSGITYSVTNIENDITQLAGVFEATINPDILLSGRSGRLRTVFSIGGINYVQTFFYDSTTLIADNITLNSSVNTGNITALSGIYFYDQLFLNVGGEFSNVNSDTIHNPFYRINCTDLNMPTLNINRNNSNLSNYSLNYNQTNILYNNTAWIVPNEVFHFSTNTIVNSSIRNSSVNTFFDTLNVDIGGLIVDTRFRTSTDTIERFKTEQYRVSQSANFDQPNQKGWISTNPVLSTDAKMFNLGIEHNQINFLVGSYEPNSGIQPNYSTHTGNQIFIREFITTGTAHSSFTLNVIGTYSLMEYKLAKAWDGTSTGGTVWIRGDQPFNLSNWNSGNPDFGFGGSLGGNIYSFGNNNIVNTNDTLYLRFTFSSGQRITSLSVVFN